jgi:SAM-dependent methyltransferase
MVKSMQRSTSESTDLTISLRSRDFGLRLRCPACQKASVEDLQCFFCGFRMETRSGIILALAPDRFSYYARFIADYEYIRAAEGRGSQDAGYYLALPNKDTTGRNSGQWTIRAKSFNYLIRRVLTSVRPGETILDLGAGNCWLSYQLLRRGFRPVAIDLLTGIQDGLGAAVHYERHLGTILPRFQAELNRLPFQDEQFAAVVFNASFHYSENYERTLREALRCVKPGGIVIICDTPWYSEEESGRQMIAERRNSFRHRFHTASDSIESLEYLTDERLNMLEEAFSIRWSVHHPWYGWRWAVRPLIAKLRRQREPSRFRIYVARKDVL